MNKVLKYFLPLLFLLFNILKAAEVNTTIVNSATISYTISGVDKNLTTNEVNNTIAATPATIEFLAFTPNGKDITLETTKYQEKNSTKTMPPAKLPNGDIINPPATIKAVNTSSYLENDLIIIKVTDIDRNINAFAQDEINITITDPKTGDIENLILKETNSSSGVFVGYIHASSSKALEENGVLSVASGSRISAVYEDNAGEAKKIIAKAEVAKLQFRLLVTKSQSKDSAAIGDFVKYSVVVENLSDVEYKDVLVNDLMSDGLEYQKDSFKFNGQSAKPTLEDSNRKIKYIIKTLAPKERVELSYVAMISPGVLNNKVVNIAKAYSEYAGYSNEAKVTLKVVEDLYNTKGFIIGQVRELNCSKIDINSSNIRKNLKEANSTVISVDGNISKKSKICGASNVRVYLENGRYAITDKNGKYHFSDVKEGIHVVAVDKESIKNRYKLVSCKQNVDYAGSIESQFVDIYKASIQRADFCVKKIKDKVANVKLLMSLKKLKDNEVELNVAINKNAFLTNIDFVLSLSEGLKYIKNSSSLKTEPIKDRGFWVFHLNDDTKHFSIKLKVLNRGDIQKDILGMLIFDTASEADKKSKIAELSLSLDKNGIVLDKSIDSVKTLLPGAKLAKNAKKLYWSKPKIEQKMPKYTKDEVEALGQKPKIVWPPKGWVPSIPSTRVAVLLPKGCSVELRLNGKKVSMLNYEGVYRSKSGKTRIIHYKGVDLRDGENIFEAIIKKGKKVIDRLERYVYVESHAPAKLEFLPKYSYLVADGVHSPVIAVRMYGKSGHKLRGGLVGVFSTDSKHSPKTLSNGKGSFVVDSDGIAYIKLKPTLIAGDTTLKIKMADGKEEELRVSLKPYLRKWIVVGFAEGSVGYRVLSGHMESLKNAGVKRGFYTKGKVAFFAKGRVKGKWLLTIAYDSGKRENDEEFYGKIDPNKYYTIYKDESTQGAEAASRKKLYIKLEDDKFYALFGDFNTNFSGSELSSYTRDFTGFKSKYRNKNFEIKAFVAKSDKLFFRDEFRGDGTRGYYYLRNKNILEGSEKVYIEIRDKDRDEIVLSTKDLVRDKDYEIDYDKGRLYFKDPIFSQDENFNPVYVVVKYEVDSNKKSSYSYGARAEYESDNKRYKLGATFVNEGRGDDRYRLYGLDAKIKINSKLSLRAEIAQSDNKIDKKSKRANAKLVELSYKDNNFSATLSYRKQDDDFGLGQLSDSLNSSRRVSLDIKKRLDENKSLSLLLYQNREYLENEIKDSNIFESKLDYKYSKYSGYFGYKFSKDSGEDAKHFAEFKIERSFLDKNITASFSHEQSLSSVDMKSSLNLAWRYDKNTTANFSIIREKNSGEKSKYNIALGIDYKPWKDSMLSYRSYYDSKKDSFYDSISISKEFIYKKKYKINLGFEKGLSDDGSDDYSSYSVGVNYENKKYSANFGADYKDAKDSKKINFKGGVYIEKSEEIGMVATFDYHKLWDEDSVDKEIAAKFAFVYRPSEEDFIFLSRFDYSKDYTKEKNQESINEKFISNSHLNWQVNDKWELSFHYGLKYNIDTIDNKKYRSWSDVFGVVAEYDISEQLRIGLQSGVYHSYTSNRFDYSAGLFITKTLWKNSNLTFGFNIVGFSDDDFSDRNYYHKGVYLRFRMKFDSGTLKDLTKGAVQ